MTEIVSVFLMSHVPLIASNPDAPPPEKRKKVMDGLDTIAQRLKELEVDTVVVVGDDHYTNFGPLCAPRCMIGIGDVEGPTEDWLGIERGPIPNNEGLAHHIMQTGFDDGIDWAVSKMLSVDHAIVIPYHYCMRSIPDIRVVPVYLNAVVAPIISNRRSAEIGENIGKAIDTWGEDERIAVFGTGGISHWVGGAEMGRVNEEFDRRVIAMCERGDIAGLVALSDEEILREGGNGALEIKNWICAMSAMSGCPAELITYEAVPEWVTGVGFIEVKAA